MTLRLPPSPPGLPFIGHLLSYRRDHLRVFRDAHRELGPVFSLRLGPQRMAVLIGPEAQRFFFTQVDKVLSLPEVYRFVIPMFGEVLNAAEDRETRHRHLALLHSAFHPKRMQAHVGAMAEEVERWLDQLGDGGEADLNDGFTTLAMRIAARALMGEEIRQCLDRFIPLFFTLARGMDFVLPPNLPLPRFRRRDQARLRLRELVAPIIRQRRDSRVRHDDFLQVLVDGAYLDPATPDHEAQETVIGLALMTIFTAYIATAAQTSWTVIQLLKHPAYLATITAERFAVFGDSPNPVISADSLNDLQKLDRALNESQRMHPVMTHYARHNALGYQFGGYDIPKGWMTVVCPAISHRDPDMFVDPDVYDPDRFAPHRQEDKRHPYALIGFGAGLYRCPGAAFGINEMKTIISLLLHRYDIQLLDAEVTPNFDMGVVRPAPCRFVYHRRKRNAVVTDLPIAPKVAATSTAALGWVNRKAGS
jgi:sterol 14-demethylase